MMMHVIVADDTEVATVIKHANLDELICGHFLTALLSSVYCFALQEEVVPLPRQFYLPLFLFVRPWTQSEFGSIFSPAL
jgi:hypothetical protein